MRRPHDRAGREAPAAILRSYFKYYHRDRNHHGLDNRRIIHEQFVVDSAAAIQRRSRLGGMLNYYYRQAA
jgi:hypothetical protein